MICDKKGIPLRSFINSPYKKQPRLRVVKHIKKYKRPQRNCIKCGSFEKAYTCPMLKDEVWLKIASKKELVCFECAEISLDRDIIVDDLNDAPINYGFKIIASRM